MIFTKKVQFLKYSVNESNLHCYDFLDLETNLPFTVYSTTECDCYKDLKPYTVKDLSFTLLRTQSKSGLSWKVKAGVQNG